MATIKLIKIRLSTSAALPINEKFETKDFKPGIHELPEAVMDHWFIKGLIKQGSIVVQGSRIEKEERKPIVAPAPVVPVEAPKEAKQKETVIVRGASIPDSQKAPEPVKTEVNIVEEIKPDVQTEGGKIKKRGKKSKK